VIDSEVPGSTRHRPYSCPYVRDYYLYRSGGWYDCTTLQVRPVAKIRAHFEFPLTRAESVSFVRTSDRNQSIMSPTKRAFAIAATEVAAKAGTNYPKQFHHAVRDRSKRALGDFFGLCNFGINHTTLGPGSASALQHHHEKQDEMVYILSGAAVCRLGDEEIEMKAGDCIGFPAGQGIGHCIINRSDKEPVVFLEIGDRTRGDSVEYPEEDLKCVEDDGKWKFLHKDGRPYSE